MNAISTLRSAPFSPAAAPAPTAAPSAAIAAAPAAALALSLQAQKALGSLQPQPTNIIWGSGPSR